VIESSDPGKSRVVRLSRIESIETRTFGGAAAAAGSDALLFGAFFDCAKAGATAASANASARKPIAVRERPPVTAGKLP
jgi:hypothetical protein